MTPQESEAKKDVGPNVEKGKDKKGKDKGET